MTLLIFGKYTAITLLQGKLSVILVVWIALIVLTTFYCYFCEQRLFPSKRLQESQAAQNLSSEDDIDTLGASMESKGGGHFQSNIISAAALPKDNLRSRKERLASTCSCNSVSSTSITGSVGPYRRFWQSANNQSFYSRTTTMTDLENHDEEILELDMSPKKRKNKFRRWWLFSLSFFLLCTITYKITWETDYNSSFPASKCLLTNASRSSGVLLPLNSSTSLPFLYKFKVGNPVTPWALQRSLLRSLPSVQSTLPILTPASLLSAFNFVANSSHTGANLLQCPHHGAKNLTNVTPSFTCSSKLSLSIWATEL